MFDWHWYAQILFFLFLSLFHAMPKAFFFFCFAFYDDYTF